MMVQSIRWWEEGHQKLTVNRLKMIGKWFLVASRCVAGVHLLMLEASTSQRRFSFIISIFLTRGMFGLVFHFICYCSGFLFGTDKHTNKHTLIFFWPLKDGGQVALAPLLTRSKLVFISIIPKGTQLDRSSECPTSYEAWIKWACDSFFKNSRDQCYFHTSGIYKVSTYMYQLSSIQKLGARRTEE